MSYAAHYYADQLRVIEQMRWAQQTGLCPVCRRRPRATWPSGAQRMTCGDTECFHRWLPSPAHVHKESE